MVLFFKYNVYVLELFVAPVDKDIELYIPLSIITLYLLGLLFLPVLPPLPATIDIKLTYVPFCVRPLPILMLLYLPNRTPAAFVPVGGLYIEAFVS